MKKARIAIITVILAAAAFFGWRTACAARFDGSWTMTYVFNADGKVIYCSAEEAASYPDAEVIDLTCTAGKGSFTIMENDTVLVNGTYQLGKYDLAGTTYDITATDGETELVGGAVASSRLTGSGMLELILSDHSSSQALFFQR